MSAPTHSNPVIFLCRHGQTEWNVVGRRQGQLDSPLTALGRSQAEQIAATVRSERIDTIFASPLGRALETARIVAERIDRPVSILADLVEMHHGQLAGMTNSEIEDSFPGALAERERDKYEWCFAGGESYADVDRRSATALSSIARSPSMRPLIVSHEMIGRMLVRNMLDLTADDALSRALPHGEVLQIDSAGVHMMTQAT